ncbi:MAG: hypothetical protein KDA69_11205, partial [Planctomycetaceae bacterium]|nr:hypothetical protein [Planctomycetaceae bacterium]
VLEKDGTRQEMDYWCDICSIPMYEIKECECCQGPIEFRLRPGRLPAYLKSRTPAQKSDVKPSDADTESASSSAPERSKK